MRVDHQNAAQFQDFKASALYCPRCKQAMPVRSRLLLILPDGELHEYLCQACASSLGTKTVRQAQNPQIYFR
jgi:transposase-like protein